MSTFAGASFGSTAPSLGGGSRKPGTDVGGGGGGGGAIANAPSRVPIDPNQTPQPRMAHSDWIMQNRQALFTEQNPEQGSPLHNQDKMIFWPAFADYAAKYPIVLSTAISQYLQDSSAWIFGFFPIKMGMRSKFTKNIIEMVNIMSEIATRKVPGREIGFTMRTMTYETQYSTQGFSVDMHHMKSPDGPQLWDQHVRSVTSNMWSLMIYMALMSMQTTGTWYNSAERMYAYASVPTTIDQFFNVDSYMFGIHNKETRGFDRVSAMCARIFEQNKKGLIAWIATRGDVYFSNLMDESQIYHDMSGNKALQTRQKGDLAETVSANNLAVYSVPYLEAHAHGGIEHNILEHTRSVGSMFSFPDNTLHLRPGEYTSNKRDVKACSWTSNDKDLYKFDEFLRHVPEFYPVSRNCDSMEVDDSKNTGTRRREGTMNRSLLMKLANSNAFNQTQVTDEGNQRLLHQFLKFEPHRGRGGSYHPIAVVGELDEAACKDNYMLNVYKTMKHALDHNLSPEERQALQEGMELSAELNRLNPSVEVQAVLKRYVSEGASIGTGYDCGLRPPNVFGGFDLSDAGLVRDLAAAGDFWYGFGDLPGLMTLNELAMRTPGVVPASIANTLRGFLPALEKLVSNMIEVSSIAHAALHPRLVPFHHVHKDMSELTKSMIVAWYTLFSTFVAPTVCVTHDAAAGTPGLSLNARFFVRFFDVIQRANYVRYLPLFQEIGKLPDGVRRGFELDFGKVLRQAAIDAGAGRANNARVYYNAFYDIINDYDRYSQLNDKLHQLKPGDETKEYEEIFQAMLRGDDDEPFSFVERGAAKPAHTAVVIQVRVVAGRDIRTKRNRGARFAGFGGVAQTVSRAATSGLGRFAAGLSSAATTAAAGISAPFTALMGMLSNLKAGDDIPEIEGVGEGFNPEDDEDVIQAKQTNAARKGWTQQLSEIVTPYLTMFTGGPVRTNETLVSETKEILTALAKDVRGLEENIKSILEKTPEANTNANEASAILVELGQAYGKNRSKAEELRVLVFGSVGTIGSNVAYLKLRLASIAEFSTTASVILKTSEKNPSGAFDLATALKNSFAIESKATIDSINTIGINMKSIRTIMLKAKGLKQKAEKKQLTSEEEDDLFGLEVDRAKKTKTATLKITNNKNNQPLPDTKQIAAAAAAAEQEADAKGNKPLAITLGNLAQRHDPLLDAGGLHQSSGTRTIFSGVLSNLEAKVMDRSISQYPSSDPNFPYARNVFLFLAKHLADAGAITDATQKLAFVTGAMRSFSYYFQMVNAVMERQFPESDVSNSGNVNTTLASDYGILFFAVRFVHDMSVFAGIMQSISGVWRDLVTDSKLYPPKGDNVNIVRILRAVGHLHIITEVFSEATKRMAPLLQHREQVEQNADVTEENIIFFMESLDNIMKKVHYRRLTDRALAVVTRKVVENWNNAGFSTHDRLFKQNQSEDPPVTLQNEWKANMKFIGTLIKPEDGIGKWDLGGAALTAYDPLLTNESSGNKNTFKAAPFKPEPGFREIVTSNIKLSPTTDQAAKFIANVENYIDKRITTALAKGNGQFSANIALVNVPNVLEFFSSIGTHTKDREAIDNFIKSVSKVPYTKDIGQFVGETGKLTQFENAVPQKQKSLDTRPGSKDAMMIQSISTLVADKFGHESTPAYADVEYDLHHGIFHTVLEALRTKTVMARAAVEKADKARAEVTQSILDTAAAEEDLSAIVDLVDEWRMKMSMNQQFHDGGALENHTVSLRAIANGAAKNAATKFGSILYEKYDFERMASDAINLFNTREISRENIGELRGMYDNISADLISISTSENPARHVATARKFAAIFTDLSHQPKMSNEAISMLDSNPKKAAARKMKEEFILNRLFFETIVLVMELHNILYVTLPRDVNAFFAGFAFGRTQKSMSDIMDIDEGGNVEAPFTKKHIATANTRKNLAGDYVKQILLGDAQSVMADFELPLKREALLKDLQGELNVVGAGDESVSQGRMRREVDESGSTAKIVFVPMRLKAIYGGVYEYDHSSVNQLHGTDFGDSDSGSIGATLYTGLAYVHRELPLSNRSNNVASGPRYRDGSKGPTVALYDEREYDLLANGKVPNLPSFVAQSIVYPIGGDPTNNNHITDIDRRYSQTGKFPLLLMVAARLALLTEISYLTMSRWYDNNIAIPLGGCIFRPWEEQTMYSQIAIAEKQLGEMHFSGFDNTVSFDANGQHFDFNAWFHAGPALENLQALFFAKDTRGGANRGGKGNKYINSTPSGDVISLTEETSELEQIFADLYSGERLGDYSNIPVLQSYNTAVEFKSAPRHVDIRGNWRPIDFAGRMEHCDEFVSTRDNIMYDNQFLINFLFPFREQEMRFDYSTMSHAQKCIITAFNNHMHQTTQWMWDVNDAESEVISFHPWKGQYPGLVGKETSRTCIPASRGLVTVF